MKRTAPVFVALLSAVLLSGCVPVRTPVIGLLFTDVQGPIDTEGTIGSKRGEACATSILGIIGTGNASIEKAASNGGIERITNVDHRSTIFLLGIYGEFCTIVYGS
jgi:hypothetical protein